MENLYDKQNELENCRFVKTILMLMVVFGHSIYFWNGWFHEFVKPVYHSGIISFCAEWLSSFHIFCFALVSGYIFYYVGYERKNSEYLIFSEFVKNKAKRLLVPAYFVSGIWGIPVAVYLRKQYGDGVGLVDIVKNFLFGIAPAQLWFLFMLFVVFVIAWILSPVFRKNFWLSFLLAVVIYALGREGKKFISNYYQIWTACSYVINFLIGFKIRQCGIKVLYSVPIIGLILITVCFVIASMWADANSIKLLSRILTFSTRLCNSVCMFVVLQRLAMKIRWHGSNMFGILEKHNFTIYLFHEQFIYFSVIYLNGMVNPYLHSVINFSLAVFCSLIISSIMFRWHWTRVIFGYKEG